jgi:hypothetical protein
LKVFDTSQVLCDVLAVGIPHVDAVSEMGAIVYRHRSLPPKDMSMGSGQKKSPGLKDGAEVDLVRHLKSPASPSAKPATLQFGSRGITKSDWRFR